MDAFDNLKQVTEQFFKLHWPIDIFGKDIPQWSEKWNFRGTIPQQEKKGCYALFSEKALLYIGIGIGNSNGLDEGSGIGQRLNRIWKVDKSKPQIGLDKIYTQTEKWSEIDGVYTIGFLPKHAYLAASLELFLIMNLKPKRNVQHKDNL